MNATPVVVSVSPTPNYQSHQKQRVGDFEVRFNYAFEIATITNYFGESNEMVIPEEIDGYKVIRFNCDGMSEEVKQRNVMTISKRWSLANMSKK